MGTVYKYQNNFTGGVLAPGLHSRSDLDKYSMCCSKIKNAVVRAHGGLSKRPGTRFIDQLPGVGRLIPFVYGANDSYVLCFHKPEGDEGPTAMRVYRDGGVVTTADGSPFSLDTPFAADEIQDIKFVQSADTMFFAHPNHPPVKLVRSGHASWAFSYIDFTPVFPAPEGVSVSTTGFVDESNTYVETEVSYKIAAVNDREIESMPSAAVTAKILSTWPTGARVKLSWNAVEGAVRYEVYKNARGYYAWVGSAETTAFTDDNIEGDSSIGPKESRNPFTSAGDYPSAVGLNQQRLIFGGSNNEPQTVWMSETGSFDSMAVSYPLRDDNAITVTVDSREVNVIRHFVALRGLLMLTSGAEFKVSGTDGVLTPLGIQFGDQSYWGSSNVPPLVIGTSLLMVERSGLVVRDLHYSLSEDGYTGNDITVLANHLFDSPVRSWAFQQSPYSTIWVCLDNGKLLTLTYLREHEIASWSEQESTGAKFISVCTLREGSHDNLYFLVERFGKFFVERQVPRVYGEAENEAFYVDSGLTYRGEAAKVITGLRHLAGQKVVALADGSVVKGLEVSATGSVFLQNAASVVHIGLPYDLIIETLNPEIKAQEGVLVAEKRTITRAALRLQETQSITIGPTEDTQTALKLPVPELYGEPPQLFTGTVDLPLQGLHRTEATVTIRQSDPLPATILAISLNIGIM